MLALAAQDEAADDEHLGRRQARRRSAEDQARIERVAAVVGRHVHHKHEAFEDCALRCAQRAAGRDQALLDEALAHAVEAGYLIEVEPGARWRAGPTPPPGRGE